MNSVGSAERRHVLTSQSHRLGTGGCETVVRRRYRWEGYLAMSVALLEQNRRKYTV